MALLGLLCGGSGSVSFLLLVFSGLFLYGDVTANTNIRETASFIQGVERRNKEGWIKVSALRGSMDLHCETDVICPGEVGW